VLGLIIGIAYVFVQRSLLRGVHDPAEVERQFGLNTYAMIPYSQKQVQINRAMRQGKKGGGSFILATQHGDDLAIESLRSLRTSLHFALLDSPNNVVMLTGPTPGLGKSFIAINLGALLANSGKRVVVVDMDLRRGHLHRYIGVSHDPGVTDFIAGDAGLDRILQKTEVDRLHLIPRGTTPPNPSGDGRGDCRTTRRLHPADPQVGGASSSGDRRVSQTSCILGDSGAGRAVQPGGIQAGKLWL
jgi:tyrosine-protein kinase Etk/Wzc